MKPILANYIRIADLIAQTMGEDCEVVLHDLENLEHSVVYTANNCVTGRMVGQSFNHLVPQLMLDKKLEKGLVTNYYFTTPTGKIIRSSTAIIEDMDGKAVGAICINVDTTRVTEQINWLQSMLPGLEHQAPKGDDCNVHVSDIVDGYIDEILDNKDIESLNRETKLQLIKLMDERGIFLLKGAVENVSKKMGISKVTIYSYIDAIRG